MIRTLCRPRLLINNKILNPRSLICCYNPNPHNQFDRLPVRNASAHNLFDKMSVNSVTRHPQMCLFKSPYYADALLACTRTEDLRNGRIIHGLVVVGGFMSRASLANCVIDMYSRCGMIDEARLVFDNMTEVDDVSWNLLFSAYVYIKWPEVASNVLVWMHRSGVKLDASSLIAVVKHCSESSDSKEARLLLHGCIVKLGLDLDFLVGNAMFDIYAQSDGLEEAIGILERIPNRSVIVFNALIAGFSSLGVDMSAEARVGALKLFSEMHRRRMSPSKFTLKSVLEACNSITEVKFGRQIHAQLIKNNLEEDERIGNALIKMYANLGYIDESLKRFYSTTNHDTDTWCYMVQGLVQDGQIERAMDFFRETLRVGIKPDRNATSSLIGGSGNFGTVRCGQQIQCHAVKSGLDCFTTCCNSLSLLYAKSGDTDATMEAFRDTAAADSVSWTAAILSHAFHGCASEAVVLFEEMKYRGVLPSEAAFLAVLTACRRGGLVEEGLRYLESMMIQYGLTPHPEHCACIVDALGRTGRLDEAEKFVSNSGFGNDKTIWWAMLRSCRFHGDVDRSIRAGEKLIELDPFASASYTMLHDLYMDIGDVSAAMRTRGRMRERGVSREADVSWIEIGPAVHSFASSDGSHPQSRAILAKLEEMLFKLRKRDHGEKRKESLSGGHGEMMAVALGMMCLPESAPIRVMKSVQVCRDCHDTLKMLSKSEGRDIVVRDSGHFHRFSRGSCSCGDYW